jgi:hypothetical protein
MKLKTSILVAWAAATCGLQIGLASSHREAPLITTTPKLDCADFYMFNSYETGRADYVTIVADYVPLQDAYGGPNFFTLETGDRGIYEIHVDNNGDAREDLTLQFKFATTRKNISLPIGPAGNQRTNAVPVVNVGQISAGKTEALNVIETYQINLIRGDRRNGVVTALTNILDGSTTFGKPVDNIGNKSIPDYETYARSYIYNVSIPGFGEGKVFVGQRKDPFVVNLGETFDLINFANPLGPVNGARDILDDKNITSLCLELPKALLRGDSTNTVIGAWTTSSRVIQTNGAVSYSQVSRLGQPLVNEVVIGLPDKDKFNASEPKDDAQFADYVTHPTLPAIIELLFGGAGVKAPTLFPRTDLVTVFLTGVPDLNKTTAVAEMLRLNLGTPAVAAAQQNNLGVIAGDVAGFPNGRRPGDDVVDIALRVVMGKLLSTNDAPSGQLPFTDGAVIDASFFTSSFPYLKPPIPGSPLGSEITVKVQAAAAVTGPFSDVRPGYDPRTSEFIAPKVADSQGYYRLSSDQSTQIQSVTNHGDSTGLTVR